MSDKNPLLYEVHVEQAGKNKRPAVNAFYDEDIAIAAAEKATRPAKLYTIQEDMDEGSGEIIETEIRLRTYSKGSVLADQTYEKVRTKMDTANTEVGDAYVEAMAKKGKSGKAAPTPEEVAAKAAAKEAKEKEKAEKKAAREKLKAERAAAKALRGDSRKRLFPADTILHIIGAGHGARAGSNRDGRYSQIVEGMKFSEYSALVKKGKAGRDVNNLIEKGYLKVDVPETAETQPAAEPAA